MKDMPRNYFLMVAVAIALVAAGCVSEIVEGPAVEIMTAPNAPVTEAPGNYGVGTTSTWDHTLNGETERLNIWGGSDVGFSSPASAPTSTVVISSNGQEGIEVGGDGTLYSRIPSEIKDNAFEGVGMWAGGHVGLEGATIADNTGHGIAALTNAAIWLTASSIENNGSDGIEVSNNSTAAFYDITVTGNGGHGISAYNHGYVQAFQDVGSSITANGMNGITVWNGASVQLHNATITGNTNDAMSASFGSRFYLSGGTVTGNIYCDDSMLSQGDTLCPE